LPSNSEVKNI